MQASNTLKDFIYSFALEQADFLLIIIDENGYIETANNSAENLVGRVLSNVPFEEMLIDFQGNYKFSDISTLRDEPVLFNVVNTSGLPLTYYFIFQPLENKIIAIGQQNAQEIDEMRRSLLSLNNDLNNLTRELHKKKVQLEKLDAQKNQFFGMASHDLRHPLGVINMYSGFLMSELASSLSTEHNEFLEYVHASGKMLEKILDDYLDFAIFESGRLVVQKTQNDITSFLEKIVSYTQMLASSKDISLKLSVPDSPVDLRFDAPKMEQVLNNLLSNAIKYSEAGSDVIIDLLLNQNEIVISVADNGRGIKEEDISRIFLPFERIEEETKSQGKSSGLGLAIVKKIMEAHGGRVWAESQYGSGTMIAVALPSDEKK